MSNFYVVRLVSGEERQLFGTGIEEAVENSGLTMDDVESFDDSTENDFKSLGDYSL